jgi:hypothetical protein
LGKYKPHEKKNHETTGREKELYPRLVLLRG